jgi:hypothetical protein
MSDFCTNENGCDHEGKREEGADHQDMGAMQIHRFRRKRGSGTVRGRTLKSKSWPSLVEKEKRARK